MLMEHFLQLPVHLSWDSESSYCAVCFQNSIEHSSQQCTVAKTQIHPMYAVLSCGQLIFSTLEEQLPFWRNLPQLVSWIFPATNTGISCCVFEVRRLIVRLFPYLSLILLRFEANVCTFTSRQICHFHGNSMSTNTDQLTSSPNKLLFHIDRRTYSCIGHPKVDM